jgi:hypothetical protein
MNTLKSNYTRSLLIASVFAAFAVNAQASEVAGTASDTQSQVRSVLEGTRSNINFGELRVSGTSARGADTQESTREVLLGTQHFNPGTHVVAVQKGGDDVQKLTQRVVLGRAAS